MFELMSDTCSFIADHWFVDGVVNKLPGFTVDLQSKLSGGTDDEDLWELAVTSGGSIDPPVQHTCDHRQEKCSL